MTDRADPKTSDVVEIPMRDGFGSVLRARILSGPDGAPDAVELWVDPDDPPDDWPGTIVSLHALGELGTWLKSKLSNPEAA